VKFTVYVESAAEQDLIEIADFLEEHRMEFGILFFKEYRETLDYLESYPQARPIDHDNLRHIKVGRFSIVLLYQIKAQEVRIYRAVHTSSDYNERIQPPVSVNESDWAEIAYSRKQVREGKVKMISAHEAVQKIKASLKKGK